MRRLYLVGAGHAHLYVLNRLRRERLPGVEVSLLTPETVKFSREMAAGYIEGLYTKAQMGLDIGELAKQAGANHIKAAVMSIDPLQKAVLTEKGGYLEYDVISFDIGALTEATDLPGVLTAAEMLRPNEKLPDALDRLIAAEQLVIAGDGDACAEIAFALQARRMKEGKTPVRWIGGFNKGTAFRAFPPDAEQWAQDAGILLHKNSRVRRAGGGKLETDNGAVHLYDRLLWIYPPRPHKLFRAALPVDSDGYLLVEKTLQVKSFPSVFGAGDCITVNRHSHIAHEGRYAVDEGPVLWKNLRGYFTDGEGRTFAPANAAYCFSTGNKQAVLRRKRKVIRAGWVHRLKSYVDRTYVKKSSP
ncbi:MAG TPA: FAD-dependent oxidoreductase [Bacillales bacterium]|nr:FAD-dependent oxidoreductase [Bacillales bacterium]